MSIDAEMEREYIEDGGRFCPYCAGPNIFREHFDEYYKTQTVTCDNCHASWYEHLVLDSLEEIEPSYAEDAEDEEDEEDEEESTPDFTHLQPVQKGLFRSF